MIQFLLSFLEYGVAIGATAALVFVFIRIPAPPFVAVIVTAVVALGLHTLSANIADKERAAAIEQARSAVVGECEAQKKISEQIANDLQSKISDLNSRVYDFKRLRGSRCIPIIRPDAARANDGSAAD